MTDLSIIEETWANVDRSYLGSRKGLDTGRNATLDGSLFQNAVFNAGVPAGTLLGRVTVGGLFGPYDNALANGQETARGLLINPVSEDPVAGKRYLGAVQWEGVAIRQRLPLFGAAVGTPGRLDAAAEAELTKFDFIDL